MTLSIGSKSQILNDQFYGGFQVNADSLSGLNFFYTKGCLTGTTHIEIIAGSEILTDDTTNYVYTLNGAMASGTSIPGGNVVLLWEVVTASGVITTITDRRGVLGIGN